MQKQSLDFGNIVYVQCCWRHQWGMFITSYMTAAFHKMHFCMYTVFLFSTTGLSSFHFAVLCHVALFFYSEIVFIIEEIQSYHPFTCLYKRICWVEREKKLMHLSTNRQHLPPCIWSSHFSNVYLCCCFHWPISFIGPWPPLLLCPPSHTAYPFLSSTSCPTNTNPQTLLCWPHFRSCHRGYFQPGYSSSGCTS